MLPASAALAESACHAAFAIGSVREAGADIVANELREVGEDGVLAHAAGEIGQDVLYGQPRTANGWFAEADGGVEDDALTIVHARNARLNSCRGQAPGGLSGAANAGHPVRSHSGFTRSSPSRAPCPCRT